MKLVTKKLAELVPYEKNPRINSNAVEAVKKSIEQCEYVAPIIVDENCVILAGHTRLKALQELGTEEIEVVVKTGLTEEQKKKYRLLDNKTAELSSWDFDMLADELEGLDFGDLELDFGITGFTDEELEALMTADVQDRPKKFKVIAEFNSENEANNCLKLLTDAGYAAEIK